MKQQGSLICRPILFSAPMVRALLAGAKAQTRRVVKPVGDDGAFVLQDYGDGWWPWRSDDGESAHRADGTEVAMVCPYGWVGDRLWVREAWRGYATDDALPPREIQRSTPVYFEATKSFYLGYEFKTGKLRPGMFMPRWASRITLEVVGVRVERLQDISEADVLAEGIRPWPLGFRVEVSGAPKHESRTFDTAVLAYRWLWNSLHGPGAWDANPWVWAVEFRRLS